LYTDACAQSIVDAASCVENISYTNPDERPAISNMSAMNYLK